MKLFFGIIIGATILAVIIALYCALIIAGRSDEKPNGNSNKGENDVFFKKQICTSCKIGKYSYALDPKSEFCPYMDCWKKNKCRFYKPLDKKSKPSILSSFKSKRSVFPPPEKIAVVARFKGFTAFNKTAKSILFVAQHFFIACRIIKLNRKQTMWNYTHSQINPFPHKIVGMGFAFCKNPFSVVGM